MEKKVLGIVFLIVLALLVVGFAFFRSYEANNPAPEVVEEVPDEITYPAIGPGEVTEAFYAWYLADDNALPSENYLDADSLTDRFKQSVTDQVSSIEGIVNDPFYCALEAPIDIRIGTTNITERRANVVVDATLSDVEAISFIAELVLEDTQNAWKIDHVVCFNKG